MSDAMLKYNYITFEPSMWDPPEELPRIILGECIVTLRGGLTPNHWTAVVPTTELARLGLGSATFELGGIVRLWYSNPPFDGEGGLTAGASADVTIGNVAIIDVEPARLGRLVGSSTESVIAYRVSIMDYRRAWVAPRGSLLFNGLLNPDPLPDGVDLVSTSELMEMCLDAMGMSSAVVSDDVNDAGHVYNLDWSGAHAPSELQRLLEYSGAVFAPLGSGSAQIVIPNTALVPSIPGDRLVRDITAASIDRRGTRVIFSTAPQAQVWTFASAIPDAPDWRYVARDPSDGLRWKGLSDISEIGADPEEAWARGLADANSSYRAQLLSEMYRCVQLDPDKFPPGKVVLLNEMIDTDLSRRPPYLQIDDLLVPQESGTFGAHADEAPLVASEVIPEQNILIFPCPLLKLKTPTIGARRTTLGPLEVPIPEEDVKPAFSVEAWDEAEEARLYGTYGFTAIGGSISGLSESTAKSYLTGYRPDTVIYCAPELVHVIRNKGITGEATNRSDMEDRAEGYAGAVLGLGMLPLRTLVVKGFYPVDLDAAVSEVVYDPRSCTTTITCYGWCVTARTVDAMTGGV